MTNISRNSTMILTCSLIIDADEDRNENRSLFIIFLLSFRLKILTMNLVSPELFRREHLPYTNHTLEPFKPLFYRPITGTQPPVFVCMPLLDRCL